jgi:hypothetical protein
MHENLESVSIEDVMYEVAEGKLEVIQLQPAKLSWLEKAVDALEESAGDTSFFKDADRFRIEQELSLSQNKELAKRWYQLITTNKKIRMQLLTNKALEVLEKYENKSPNSSTSDISFARAVLFMCNTDKEKDVIRKPVDREEDEYSEVERSMERDKDEE